MRFASTGLFFVGSRAAPRLLHALVLLAATLTAACHTSRFQCGPRTDTTPPQPPPPESAPQRTALLGGIVVQVDPPMVEVPGWSCLDSGWLEQVACSPATREHESLVVIEARPSDIHAALLLAGFVPGEPGQWKCEQDQITVVPPRGASLSIFVRYETSDGRSVEEPISRWIIDATGDHGFPQHAWIFGGSRFAANPDWMGPGEHYVADMTGSIIGLATFGDEMIGFAEVLSDQESIQAPIWQAHTMVVPPPGTRVTLLIRRAETP